MASLALAEGVSPAALLLETASHNSVENVTWSLRLLGERGLMGEEGTGLLVSAGWHLGRLSRIARSVFPAGVRWLCCASQSKCTRDNWRRSRAHRRLVHQK